MIYNVLIKNNKTCINMAGIQTEGVIIELLPNLKFKIRLQNDSIIICSLSGKMRMRNIRVAVGDTVNVEVCEYDLKAGRITYRQK